MFPRTSYHVVVRALGQWSENQDTRLAAAISYYTLFSIAPLLLLAITVASWVYDEQEARETVYKYLRRNIGPQSTEAIKTLIDNSKSPEESWGPTVSLTLLAAGALGLFVGVRNALCTIWKLQPPRGNTYLGILLDYALALIMVFFTGIFLLASLVVSTVLPIVLDWLPDEHLAESHTRWRLVEMASSLVLLTFLFAAVYRVLSGNRLAWRYVWYGSLIAALLFTVGKTLMGYYLLYFSPSSAHGAAGSVMVFLLWVYYSSLILFLGAELIQARRTRHEWEKPASA